MFGGSYAREPTSAGKKQVHYNYSGPTGTLRLQGLYFILTSDAIIILVSLFNNAKHIDISDSQITTQIQVQGHTGS